MQCDDYQRLERRRALTRDELADALEAGAYAVGLAACGELSRRLAAGDDVAAVRAEIDRLQREGYGC